MVKREYKRLLNVSFAQCSSRASYLPKTIRQITNMKLKYLLEDRLPLQGREKQTSNYFSF